MEIHVGVNLLVKWLNTGAVTFSPISIVLQMNEWERKR